MFKFAMIVYNSFYHLNEQMMVNDQQFCQKWAQTEMSNGKMTKVVAKILQDILQFILFISW